MKQFGQLLLAAVLGSTCTIGAYQWLGKENNGVKIEKIPFSQRIYKKNTDFV